MQLNRSMYAFCAGQPGSIECHVTLFALTHVPVAANRYRLAVPFAQLFKHANDATAGDAKIDLDCQRATSEVTQRA